VSKPLPQTKEVRTARYSFLAATGLSGLLVGCGVVASRSEYATYRAYRYETDQHRRVELAADYLEHYPRGLFRRQAESDLRGRDDEFWDGHRDTEEGVRQYVALFPAGSHLGEAQSRLNSWQAQADAVRERNLAEERERIRIREQQLRLEALRRKYYARTTIAEWLRLVGGLDGWGQTIPTLAERNVDFNNAFGSEPRPQCRAGRCRKSLGTAFVIPIPGRSALQRQLALSVDLLRPGGNVVQAMVLFHRKGLSTWYEAETDNVVEDAEGRQTAVAWSLRQLQGIVATVFPDARETPPELYGPDPEMEGSVSEDDSAPPDTTRALPPIPPRPLGVQWSYVVGCNRGGAQITVPENARPADWTETNAELPNVRSCLRIDAYSALDIEGMSTDEGLRISYIAPNAIPGARPTTPPRPGAPTTGPRPPGTATPPAVRPPTGTPPRPAGAPTTPPRPATTPPRPATPPARP